MCSQSKKMSLDSKNDLHSTEYRWFAIYAKFRAEKHIVKSLSKKGIEAYIPLLRKTKKYTQKIKNYEVPLINCYVFVKVTKQEYVRVLETDYVMSFVKINKTLIAIPQQEIDLLKRVVGEFENIALTKQNYKQGDLVEIISGNLTGLKGFLLNINGKNDFLINLEKSGIRLSINIDPKLIRPIGLESV